ncbi:MAG: hypothetical protein FWC49_00055, partial [Proteobacteria bacterium]|nr:hypothetical protein [Pseudomonadota bacterium]
YGRQSDQRIDGLYSTAFFPLSKRKRWRAPRPLAPRKINFFLSPCGLQGIMPDDADYYYLTVENKLIFYQALSMATQKEMSNGKR